MLTSETAATDVDSVLGSMVHKQKPNISRTNVIYQIQSLAIGPVITMLFHPLFNVINAIIVGRHDNAVRLLATLGLAMLAINACITNVQIGFNSSLATLISQAAG